MPAWNDIWRIEAITSILRTTGRRHMPGQPPGIRECASIDEITPVSPCATLGKTIDPMLPIAAQVRQILQDRIVTNALSPGTLLSENELSLGLRVSRQPVREALIRLSESGLVRALPQRGTEVTRIDTTAVRSGRFVRQAVECAAVREAARCIDPPALEGLSRIVAAQRAASRARDHGRFLVLDDQFHQALLTAAGHAPAWGILRSAKLQMDRVRYLSLTEATPMARLVSQHQAILSAVAQHAAAAAAAAMQAHLSELLDSLPRIVADYPDYFDELTP